MTYDCIIIGLGPAGSSAAYYLAKKGLSVLALDKERFPRHKPCGGCVSYKAEHLLPPDFKAVVNNSVNGVVFSYKGKKTVEFRGNNGPVGYMVSREVFDAYLVKKAEEAGAEIKEGERLLDIDDSQNSVTVFSSKDRYKGRYLIGADGANSSVAKRLGLAKERGLFITINAEIKTGSDDDFSDLVEIDIGAIPYGYGWVFPKNGCLDIGIASVKNESFNPKKYFLEFIKKRPFLKDIKIEKTYAFRLPTNPENTPLNIIGKSALLAGDAAGLTDPLVGEGIYYAIKSGHIAGETIVNLLNKDSDISNYRERISKEFIAEFNYAWKAIKLVYSMPYFWSGIIKRNSKIVEFYYKVLRGEETYSSFAKKLKAVVEK